MSDLPICKLCKSESHRTSTATHIYHDGGVDCPIGENWFTPNEWNLLMGDERDINAIANRVCGDIPEDFEMQLYMENGYGGIELFHKGNRVEIDMADWKIHEQVDVAFQCIAQIIEEQGDD